MQLSGVLLVAQPGRLTEAMTAVRQIPGVDLHDVDAESERAIAVIEADDTHALVDTFKTIESLESVLKVSPVNHYFE